MSPARVTVVMPLFQGAAHVAEAVTSVLAQSWPDVQLIVADDGSTDDGPDIVRRVAPDATILTLRHTGVAAARNPGIRAAEGEYLTFLDADDILPAESVAVRVSRLESDPTLAAVFGRIEEFVTLDEADGSPPRLRSAVGPTDARLAGTMMIRRQTFLDLGEFDPESGRWYFMHWLARFSRSQVAWTQVPDVVLRRRLHATNSGLSAELDAPQLLGTLRAALARDKPSPDDDDA